ncbi:MAG: L,D-transpeptidase Cds6 family protein [Burkholderiales bacterium]
MRRPAAIARAAAALLLLPLLAFGASPESELSGVMQAIEANRLDLALGRVEKLIAEHPNFRLAHLIRGDLLTARARPLQTFGDVVKTVPREKVEDLRAEALVRLRAQRERPRDERLPRALLQLDPRQKYALLIDSRRSRLFVYENVGGLPHYVADYYVTLGKRGVDKARAGDQKTPIGVYHVIANVPRQKLTDFYGAGAYPINYPNEWDRQRGRDGYGIWVHGTPSDTYSRPPRASDGCIVLANPDLVSVGHYVQVGATPVIITDEIEWTDPQSLEADRAALAAAIERWRGDWESRDAARYLAHYAGDFHSGSEDLAAWTAHKRAVNAGKTWIQVTLSNVSMLRYPRERDFVAVTFEQQYRSSNLSNTMRKLQYWKKEGGRWRILYEGSA